jgi:hypothetical protein
MRELHQNNQIFLQPRKPLFYGIKPKKSAKIAHFCSFLCSEVGFIALIINTYYQHSQAE